jgi:NhaA family Na+:H+ antiporter
MTTQKKQPFLANSIRFLLENSAFLIAGAFLGLIWANLAPDSYHGITHTPEGHHSLFSFFINDIAMAFFFLLAGAEIREAMLPGGALSRFKTAALPVMATLGGMAGPALIYFGCVKFFRQEALANGWAVPMATDIAFSYLIARLIFPRVGGRPHPAVLFLLLLAIADDAGGLIVLATFYPQEVHPILGFLGHTPPKLVFACGFLLAVVVALLMWKRFKIVSFWPYLLGPGVIFWFAFHDGGIHPALALVPLAWCMPHAHTDLGVWDIGESEGKDTLNRVSNWWSHPVEIILGFFGFVNAGVEFKSLGPGTWFVFCGLLFGKPIGIVLFTKLGQLFKLELPRGMNSRDLVTVGCAAGIGFTVALFVSIVAFPQPGPVLDSVKMGALFSFAVAPVTLILARILKAGKG